MYSHRDPRHRVDVVDLDPYGTAAPFIDAAIGSIADGGERNICPVTKREEEAEHLRRSALCDMYGSSGTCWLTVSGEVVCFVSSYGVTSSNRLSFSNYGGVCVAAEYSHETALRLVLNSIATTAARYGRFITPLLSFSIDFYVRLFIRVDSGPAQVKELARSVYPRAHRGTPN